MNNGLFFVLIAYTIWGFFPAFFKLLEDVPALEIITHRIIWSFVFLALLLWLKSGLPKLKQSLTRKTFGIYALAGVILTINWLTYVWGVNTDQIVQTSLGYFINPLISVLIGVLILKEKLRPLQWLPILLATIGVVYLTITMGSLPWIALVLALTFGFYSFLKKIAPLKSVHGLTIETGAVVIPALVYMFFLHRNEAAQFAAGNHWTTILLILAGPITALPLIFFAAGTPRVSLVTIGILQYIAPTIQFLIGIFFFHEPFVHAQMIGYGFVWAAVLIFTTEGLMENNRAGRTTR